MKAIDRQKTNKSEIGLVFPVANQLPPKNKFSSDPSHFEFKKFGGNRAASLIHFSVVEK